MGMIKFFGQEHETMYYSILDRMKKKDCYHQTVAYLITLDRVCREHIDNLFDFEQDIVLTHAISEGWQTGTSVKTTRLAFNLWCTFVDEIPRYSTPDELFCSEYARGYFEAIKLRYPEYTN